MLEAGFSCLLLLLSVARLSKIYMSFIYQYLIYISFIYNWFVVVVLLRLIDFCGLIDFFFFFLIWFLGFVFFCCFRQTFVLHCRGRDADAAYGSAVVVYRMVYLCERCYWSQPAYVVVVVVVEVVPHAVGDHSFPFGLWNAPPLPCHAPQPDAPTSVEMLPRV